MLERCVGIIAFYKALLANPRTIGAVIPSSKYLAKEMASHVPMNNKNLVVELGPGTGVVTEALLKMGIAPERIVAVEYSYHFACQLHKRFPNIHIIRGDAVNLLQLLGDDKENVCAVVSSLPLRSLPRITANIIVNQISQLLQPNGKYIQFTYGYKKNDFDMPHRKIFSKRIWTNIPPARVDVFAA